MFMRPLFLTNLLRLESKYFEYTGSTQTRIDSILTLVMAKISKKFLHRVCIFSNLIRFFSEFFKFVDFTQTMFDNMWRSVIAKIQQKIYIRLVCVCQNILDIWRLHRQYLIRHKFVC